jgi:hypothetical protein
MASSLVLDSRALDDVHAPQASAVPSSDYVQALSSASDDAVQSLRAAELAHGPMDPDVQPSLGA